MTHNFGDEKYPFVDAPQENNPYAPPLTFSDSEEPKRLFEGGVWRQGKVLIMQRHATLPPFCVKSNEPATVWLPRKLQWHPPWVYVLLLFNLVIFAVVALIMTKRVTIQIGLTEDWMARRQQRTIIATAAALTGVALICLACAFLNEIFGSLGPDLPEFLFGTLLLLGALLTVGAAIYGNYACRMVAVEKIDDTHIWLKGVNPEFLNRLPIWEG